MFPAQNISSLAVQLCREDMKYFNFFNVTVYQNTYSFFLRSFSLAFMHWYVQFINQGFKCFRVNFFILKFHCFMFRLNFITSKYSFFRQKRCQLGIVPYHYFQTRQILGQFLANIFSTVLVLPTLIVLRTLTNLLEQFRKIFLFFTFVCLNFR